LKQGDGLAPNLFNIALEYIIKEQSEEIKFTVFYKTVLLTGYVDHINIMGRTNGAVCDVYEELKERATEAGLNIRGKKSMVQNRITTTVKY
jgi:hypothetical protein